VEGKTIEALTWLMEVERRMRFQVIENSMTRNAISASTFPGHPRCNSIPSCWVSMLRGVRFCSSLHLLSDTFGAGKPAPKRITCILYGVMIPYGKCLVNYAQGTPISACIGSTSRVIYIPINIRYARSCNTSCTPPRKPSCYSHIVDRDYP